MILEVCALLDTDYFSSADLIMYDIRKQAHLATQAVASTESLA